MTWSKQSRRSEPISRSAYGFCHGDLAAVTTSSAPRPSIACRMKFSASTTSPARRGGAPRLNTAPYSSNTPQLKVFRPDGILGKHTVRPELQRRIYSLRSDGFAELDAWLSHYRQFWQMNLEALERYLDTATRPGGRKRRKRRETQ